jgi:hypothetical protein
LTLRKGTIPPALREGLDLAAEGARSPAYELTLGDGADAATALIVLAPKVEVLGSVTFADAVACACVPPQANYGAQSDADRLSNISRQKRRGEIVQAVSVIEPGLVDLQVLFQGGGATIYADLGEEQLVRLSFVGEGMVRLTSLALAIADTPGGIVLIDEIENGLHHSVLYDVWRVVAEAARQVDCQVFATTHSFECIQAAHEAFKDSGTYDLRVHRLERNGDTIDAITLDEDRLEALLNRDMEVR